MFTQADLNFLNCIESTDPKLQHLKQAAYDALQGLLKYANKNPQTSQHVRSTSPKTQSWNSYEIK